jgi:hypothetical protein
VTGSYFSRKEKIAFERQEHGRAFEVLGERKDRRAVLPLRSERDANI